jgi:prophage regulatory protein
MDPELRERLERPLEGGLKDRRWRDQRIEGKFYHQLLDSDDLWACGIRFSRQHLYRLIKAGLFPKPIKLGSGGRNPWIADEINAWIKARISERDATERQTLIRERASKTSTP